jgi:hypothetical protein
MHRPQPRRPLQSSRRLLPVFPLLPAILVLGSLALPGVLQAQAQTGTSCTYDECALRIRAATFTQPPMLVRGMAGEEITPVTPFGAPIAPHFATSDSAYAQALRYDRISPTAGVLGMAGPAVLILGPMLTNWRERPIASFALLAGGLGMTMYGTHLSNVAMDALNRAVWWYNRSVGQE